MMIVEASGREGGQCNLVCEGKLGGTVRNLWV